ncbi:MAG: riboflavin synthase [Candidatus Omnitrophota bacterium]
MFTGIIEALGRVGSTGANKIALEAELFAGAKKGDSISINGVCLTISELKDKAASFDVSGETKNRTNLGRLKIGEKANLERALKLGERLGGHFVSGHIDCTGKISAFDAAKMTIDIPREFMKYAAEKGSIAVDGISLTLNNVKNHSFTVYIIPHTLKATTLGFKKPGDSVNIEFDILAKYAENFSAAKQTKITKEFLAQHGLL